MERKELSSFCVEETVFLCVSFSCTSNYKANTCLKGRDSGQKQAFTLPPWQITLQLCDTVGGVSHYATSKHPFLAGHMLNTPQQSKCIHYISEWLNKTGDTEVKVLFSAHPVEKLVCQWRLVSRCLEFVGVQQCKSH